MRNKSLLQIIFLFLFLFTPILKAQTNYQETILQANKLYKESSFEEAFNLYKKVPDPSPQINYNLGNCAYKLNKLGYALLYWKRAEKEWGLFNKSELLENIALLKKKLQPQSNTPNSFFIIKSNVLGIIKSVPIILIQLIFLIVWIFLFIYLRYLYKRKQKILITLLFLIIATLGGTLVIRYNLDHKTFGIITSKKASMFSGPNTNFQELGIIPEASEIEIQKASSGFYKIKFNKSLGWVNKKEVGKI